MLLFGWFINVVHLDLTFVTTPDIPSGSGMLTIRRPKGTKSAIRTPADFVVFLLDRLSPGRFVAFVQSYWTFICMESCFLKIALPYRSRLCSDSGLLAKSPSDYPLGSSAARRYAASMLRYKNYTLFPCFYDGVKMMVCKI